MDPSSEHVTRYTLPTQSTAYITLKVTHFQHKAYACMTGGIHTSKKSTTCMTRASRGMHTSNTKHNIHMYVSELCVRRSVILFTAVAKCRSCEILCV